MHDPDTAQNDIDRPSETTDTQPIHHLCQVALNESDTVLSKVIRFIGVPLIAMEPDTRQKLESFTIAVAVRLSNIAPERIVPPPAYIVGPVLHAAIFTNDVPELRGLYVKLVATAMNSRSVRNAHPSFVEVIKNLTPDESKIIASLGRNAGFASLCIRCYFEIGSELIKTDMPQFGLNYRTILDSYAGLARDAGCENPDYECLYIVNLTRLGMLERRETPHIASADRYRQLRSYPEVASALKITDLDGRRCKTKTFNQMLEVTDFARKFIQACVDT